MVKHQFLVALFICLLSMQNAIAGVSKSPVTVYVYHLQPPLIISLDKEQGIYFDYVQYLNMLSEKYDFKVVYLPRKRVERMLDNHTLEGILLGVNPKWFKDQQETKYLWTTKVISGRDEVVSLKAKPYEYNGPDSLTDKVIGGVRGFYYYGISELVWANKAKRVDTVTEPDLLTMLLKQRVEVAIIGKLTFDFITKKNNWKNQFYLSSNPHDVFERKILIPQKMSAVHSHLQELNRYVQQSELWLKTLARYSGDR